VGKRARKYYFEDLGKMVNNNIEFKERNGRA